MTNIYLIHPLVFTASKKQYTVLPWLSASISCKLSAAYVHYCIIIDIIPIDCSKFHVTPLLPIYGKIEH